MTIYRVIVSHGAFDGFYDFNNPSQAMTFAEAVFTNGKGNYMSRSSDKEKPKAVIHFMTPEEIKEEQDLWEQKFKEDEKEADKDD